jgi:hypothetical protein
MKAEKHYSDVWWLLRLGLGGSAFLAGLDKFTDILTDWDKYLAPAVAEAAPVDKRTFMRIVGVIEMAAGLGILTRNTKLSATITSLWLLGIAGNLALHDERYYDIAVRDVNMALGAYALARLTGDRQKRAVPLAEKPERNVEEVRENMWRGLRVVGGRGGSSTEQGEPRRRKAA